MCVEFTTIYLYVYMDIYVYGSIIFTEITHLAGQLPNYNLSPVANEIHKQMLKHKGTYP